MTLDPLTSRPLSVKAPPSTAIKNQLPTDLDDVIMTLLSLSPDPPVWVLSLNQSLLMLHLLHLHTCVHTWPRVPVCAVNTTLCLSLNVVFNVIVCACVCALKQTQCYDVNVPKGQATLIRDYPKPKYSRRHITCANVRVACKNCSHLNRNENKNISSRGGEFMMWLSVLCVEGSDGNWGHEARTSKEVNIRDQQAALHRLAARPQACKDVSCCIQSRIRRSDEHKSADASSSRSIITVPVSVCLCV